MTNQNYSIDDGNGNQITAGLQEHNATEVAQRIANERGASVWLYPSPVRVDDAGEFIDESVEIVPEES